MTGSDSPQIGEPRGRNRALDGLRALAALSVLAFHLWLYARPTPPASSADGFGDWTWSNLRLGLTCFFVLSGYLLYRPWLEAALGERSRPELLRYARSRAARILPAYYLALAGALILLSGTAGVPGVRLPPEGDLWLFGVFGQNFDSHSLLTLDPPMWTLTIEVSFYAALPLIAIAALRIGRRIAGQLALTMGLLLLGLLWTTVVRHAGGALPLTKVLPAMLPYFALGMTAALWRVARLPSPPSALALTAAATALAINVALTVAAPGVATALHDIPAAIAFALVILLADSARRVPLLGSRLAAYLGEISFGIYLWHVPLLWWLRAHGLLPLSPIAAAPVVLAPTLLIAAASWRWVERPAIRWAKRRPPSPRLPDATAEAVAAPHLELAGARPLLLR